MLLEWYNLMDAFSLSAILDELHLDSRYDSPFCTTIPFIENFRFILKYYCVHCLAVSLISYF